MELTCISESEVYLDGHELDIKPSLKRYNHSPSGFSWGYGGSGPSQLALAIMLKMTDEEQAMQKYQQFKFDVIARLPQKPCSLEMDFYAWLQGDKNYRFEVRELDLNETPDVFSNRSKASIGEASCTKGYEDRCFKAHSKSCHCQCGGVNHGKGVK